MQDELAKALKTIIKQEIGEMVSDELKTRFQPIQSAIDTIQKSNDAISEQIKDDRQDINQLKIDMAKGITQNKVIIENQNLAEDKMVQVVKEEASKIPKQAEKAVEKMFLNQSFLKRLKERFGK